MMYQQQMRMRFWGPLTPTVKSLMIINGVVFLIQQVGGLLAPGLLESVFGISYAGVFYSFFLWQPLTYMFLHGGFMHIFFNLFTLWMFGGELENLWGGRKFLRYYLLSGIGAGFFILAMNYYSVSSLGFAPQTIGASGAIYALLMAYGYTWPNREVLLYFLFPIKVKYIVLGLGLMEFFGSLSMASGKAGNISHIGHLGGLLCGYILLRFFKNSSMSSASRERASIISDAAKKIRLQKKQSEIDQRIKAKKIINESLAKIARSGMDSLTREERKQLEWARKNYYPSGKETLH